MSKTPDEITEALMAPFPAEFIELKGPQKLRYIAQEHIRKRLIDATGNEFSWHITDVEYRNDGALRDRTDRNTGALIPAPPVCIVRGVLKIPALNSEREGIGVQEIEAGQGADSAYKGAESDAFKRASMAYGVGLLQLYIGEDLPANLQDRRPAQNTASQRPQNGHAANTTSQGANDAPRPPRSRSGASGGNGVTEKQIDFIERLAKQKHIPLDEVEAKACADYRVARMSGMGGKDASTLIDWLKEQPTRDELTGTEPGVFAHPAPPTATDDNEAKRNSWRRKIEAAAKSSDVTAAYEKLCDEADSPGKWVMLANMAPDMAAIDVIGMAAVDRGEWGPHLERAIAARKTELSPDN